MQEGKTRVGGGRHAQGERHRMRINEGYSDIGEKGRCEGEDKGRRNIEHENIIKTVVVNSCVSKIIIITIMIISTS